MEIGDPAVTPVFTILSEHDLLEDFPLGTSRGFGSIRRRAVSRRTKPKLRTSSIDHRRGSLRCRSNERCQVHLEMVPSKKILIYFFESRNLI